MSSRTDKIRDLNDSFRKSLMRGGQCVITSGVAALGSDLVATALNSVRTFDAFTGDNDPYGEHDFGSFQVGMDRFFWKIDYYDTSMRYGSEDPSDSVQTKRVLTIMLADEY
jgi:hypothetical protein